MFVNNIHIHTWHVQVEEAEKSKFSGKFSARLPVAIMRPLAAAAAHTVDTHEGLSS